MSKNSAIVLIGSVIFLLFWLISCEKIILFYLYFMSILVLSHLFLYYFILSDLDFIPILPDSENRATILFVFTFILNLF